MSKFLVILVVFLGPLILQGQDEQEPIYQFDTVGKEKKLKILALPIAFVTPETGVGFGGGAQLFLLNQTNLYNSRLSNVLISSIYTLNKQFLLDIQPQIYLNQGDFYLDMALKFQIFPNSFWGIGSTTPDLNEESYDMTSFQFQGRLLKRLPPALNFGLEFVYENHDVTEVKENGILDSGEILGSDRAIISGLGAVFNLDTRDNVAAPSSGKLFQINARFSGKAFGATSSFSKFLFDLRSYHGIGKKSVIALQIFTENNFGDTPFQAKAWFGGGDGARGYFRGRFIEDNQFVWQVEYRLGFHPRWKLAAFALMGNVADVASNFFNDIKPATGGGIRFKLAKDQDTLLRLDVGIGKDGNNGFYFGVNEAF